MLPRFSEPIDPEVADLAAVISAHVDAAGGMVAVLAEGFPTLNILSPDEQAARIAQYGSAFPND